MFGLVAHTSYRQVLLRPLLDYTRNKDSKLTTGVGQRVGDVAAIVTVGW